MEKPSSPDGSARGKIEMWQRCARLALEAFIRNIQRNDALNAARRAHLAGLIWHVTNVSKEALGVNDNALVWAEIGAVLAREMSAGNLAGDEKMMKETFPFIRRGWSAQEKGRWKISGPPGTKEEAQEDIASTALARRESGNSAIAALMAQVCSDAEGRAIALEMRSEPIAGRSKAKAL